MNYNVKVDVSSIYELMASFMVYTSKKWTDNMDIGPDWINQVEAQLPSSVRETLSPASSWPFSDFDLLYMWIIHRHTGDDVGSFLAYLEQSSVDSLFTVASPFLPTMTTDDVQRIRHDYVPLLHLWYEHYFKTIEQDIIPLLEEDALEKKSLLNKMDPEQLIEYASGGLVVEDLQDLKTVVLFPTVHNRPINTYCFYTGILLIQYPVDVPEENEEIPPTCLTRMTHALTDQTRLRLLRYITNQPKSLTEMHIDLDQPMETLKHHLMILRVAGFLRIHIDDHNNEKFSIRTDGVAELRMFLESYIQL
ncbi:ArsR/SmtB family transcription factor [Paenibacillus sp. CMAA1364]